VQDACSPVQLRLKVAQLREVEDVAGQSDLRGRLPLFTGFYQVHCVLRAWLEGRGFVHGGSGLRGRFLGRYEQRCGQAVEAQTFYPGFRYWAESLKSLHCRLLQIVVFSLLLLEFLF
jgi:hypothetical protein